MAGVSTATKGIAMIVPKLDPALRAAIDKEARRLDIAPAALAAVVAVESGGRLFARVNGCEEPLIRFEGHYFDRRLAGRLREIARKAGLADPRPGAVRNPRSQAARWAMLKRAASIHHAAAHESCSWGCGQVMGSHWRWLDYPSVDALVADARNGVGGQVRLMGRFIGKSGLDDALRRQDFRSFAKSYNGAAYGKNAYDRKMAEAFDTYSKSFGGDPAAPPEPAQMLLRRGSRGEAVLSLQRDLEAAGCRLAIDGVFGPATEAAVKRVQTAHGLVGDGIVGPRTRTVLAGVPPGRSAPATGARSREGSVAWALLTLLHAVLQRVFARRRLD